jgi:6-pyruvoyltetrahydropterin/6-carboxytetrahydropterin synthase
MLKVCRRSTFNSAHRLFQPNWTDEKNDAVYGKCNNPNFHGHNYTLEVWVEGELDQSIGYLIDLKLLKTIIQTEIIERFDHRNLNLDCLEFATLIPTAENIAIVIYEILRNVLDPKYKISIKLWETENNMVFYDGE